MKVIARNKKASHNYFLEDRYEAGIVLQGTEIKSIRAGRVNIQDAYIRIRRNEAFILNMHIGKYKEGNIFNHDETRERKLLLHKREIVKLFNKVQQDRINLIPTEVYLKEGLCKITFAEAKGKKLHDKRHTLKAKDEERHMKKALKDRT